MASMATSTAFTFGGEKCFAFLKPLNYFKLNMKSVALTFIFNFQSEENLNFFIFINF